MGGDDSQKLRPWRGTKRTLLRGAADLRRQQNQHSTSKAICLLPIRSRFAFKWAEQFAAGPKLSDIKSVGKLNGQRLP
jgi:hypothetical protein